MVNTVQEKINMVNLYPSKKNDTQMNKKLGKSGSEIKYLGRSNQKIRRKLK